MGFYNVQKGDAPYFKYLADTYTLSDNMHQSVMGGTGANHIMFGYADGMWYSDGKGNIATPPTEQIENPNPQPGTNDWWDQDGYSGGSYSNCSDSTQAGVTAVENYLESLSTPISPRCAEGAYYLLNNYNPGYLGNGSSAFQYSQFSIPPTAQPHIGDVLSAAGVSWTYFGEGWDLYVSDPAGTNPYDAYCNICNPFQYASDIMTSPAEIAAHIQDTTSLYEDIDTGNLPAVSIVKPSGFVDGHPASSKLDLFEGFVNKIVNQVQASSLWSSTAIFITEDEGGGYYDSGYIQPVDFFGDGTRIPLLIVSPYSTGGVVNHSYADHVSIIKFIERNWAVGTIGAHTRDTFPNPTVNAGNPYVPTNSPALDDLFDAFNFGAAVKGSK
jgi:phospholipase C